MGIRLALIAALLLLPHPAQACIDGDMFDPTFAAGFWGLAGFILFAVAFTYAQRIVIKRQLKKAGVTPPEHFDKTLAAGNALIFSSLALLFLFAAGMAKIDWASITKLDWNAVTLYLKT